MNATCEQCTCNGVGTCRSCVAIVATVAVEARPPARRTGIGPAVAESVTVHVTLAWQDRGQWDPRSQRACRVCGQPTNLRDSRGVAAHKACVEGAIEAKVVEFARTLIEREQSRTAVAA